MCGHCAKSFTNVMPFWGDNCQDVPFTKERTEPHKGKALAKGLTPGMWQSWDLKPQIFRHDAQMSTASKSLPFLPTRIMNVPGAWGRGCWFCGQTPARRMSSVWASKDWNSCPILLTIVSISPPAPQPPTPGSLHSTAWRPF